MPNTDYDLSPDMDAILRGIRGDEDITISNGDVTSESQVTNAYEISKEKDAQIQAHIEENPIYRIIQGADAEETQLQQVDKLAKLFAFDEQTSAQTIQAARDYLYYIHMVRRTLADQQLSSAADGLFGNYQRTMEEFHGDLIKFQDTIAPLKEGFELIQACREEEIAGKAEPLVTRITKAIRAKERKLKEDEARHNKAEKLLNEADGLEDDRIPSLKREIADEQDRFFLVRSGKKIAEKENLIEKLRKEIADKRQQAEDLKAQKSEAESSPEYDQKILKILNVGGEAFQKKAQETAEQTKALIVKTRDRMEDITRGYTRVHDGVQTMIENATDIQDSALAVLLLAVKKVSEEKAAEGEEVKAAERPAETTDAEAQELAAIQKKIEANKKRRYVANLQSVQRGLESASTSIRTGLTTLETMDQNVHKGFERALELGNNTVATVADMTAIFLHAISLESNNSSTDMVDGVLKSMREASNEALKMQISTLPDWFRQSNLEMAQQLKSITAISGLLEKATGDVLTQRKIMEGLRRKIKRNVDDQRVKAEKMQIAQVQAVEPASLEATKQPANDTAPTRATVLTRGTSGANPGMGSGQAA